MINLKPFFLWTGALLPPFLFCVGMWMAFSQSESLLLDYCVPLFILSPVAGFLCSFALLFQNCRLLFNSTPSQRLHPVSAMNFVMVLWQSKYLRRLVCLSILIAINGLMVFDTLDHLFSMVFAQ